MTLSNSAENNLMKLLFENTNWANVGDATGLRGSSTAGSFYVALYTSDPGEAGTATTNETAYTDYARVAVARSTAGWRDKKAAWINIVGFAAMVFNLFFINLVTVGLHSYAGV